MVERKQPEHKNEIAWGLFLAGAALAFPILTGGASLYIGVRNDLADLRLDVSRNTQFRTEHPMCPEARQAIRELQTEINGCKLKLAELSSTIGHHANP